MGGGGGGRSSPTPRVRLGSPGTTPPRQRGRRSRSRRGWSPGGGPPPDARLSQGRPGRWPALSALFPNRRQGAGRGQASSGKRRWPRLKPPNSACSTLGRYSVRGPGVSARAGAFASGGGGVSPPLSPVPRKVPPQRRSPRGPPRPRGSSRRLVRVWRGSSWRRMIHSSGREVEARARARARARAPVPALLRRSPPESSRPARLPFGPPARSPSARAPSSWSGDGAWTRRSDGRLSPGAPPPGIAGGWI